MLMRVFLLLKDTFIPYLSIAEKQAIKATAIYVHGFGLDSFSLLQEEMSVNLGSHESKFETTCSSILEATYSIFIRDRHLPFYHSS